MYESKRPEHTTITYNQQPHDAADAARLYGELEEKALEKIKEVIFNKIGSINVEFVDAVVGRSIDSFGEYTMIMFKINGERYNVRYEPDVWSRTDPSEYVKGIANEIARVVTEDLVTKSTVIHQFKYR